MAKIGSLGSLVFSVSENTVRTFDELSWKVSAKYATHDRHIKRDVLEFLGPEPGTISFKMAFSVFHGTNPLKEIEQNVQQGQCFNTGFRWQEIRLL